MTCRRACITGDTAAGDPVAGAGRGQYLDADRASGNRRPLVYAAEPVLAAAGAGAGAAQRTGIQRGVKRGAHYSPFILTLLLVFLGLSGLGISIWPHLIPPAISLWDAAAPPQSLGFMLVGALFIIPIILVYTFWSYYVFRGKISHEHGYH